MQQSQAACVGAAALAGVGVGIFPDVAAATERLAGYGDSYQPDASSADIHDRVYQRYLSTYDALLPVFPTLRSQDQVPA